MYANMMVNSETEVHVLKSLKMVRIEFREGGKACFSLLFNNQDQVHTLLSAIQGELDPVPQEVAA
jgi:hypothetical protein